MNDISQISNVSGNTSFTQDHYENAQHQPHSVRSDFSEAGDSLKDHGHDIFEDDSLVLNEEGEVSFDFDCEDEFNEEQIREISINQMIVPIPNEQQQQQQPAILIIARESGELNSPSTQHGEPQHQNFEQNEELNSLQGEQLLLSEPQKFCEECIPEEGADGEGSLNQICLHLARHNEEGLTEEDSIVGNLLEDIPTTNHRKCCNRSPRLVNRSINEKEDGENDEKSIGEDLDCSRCQEEENNKINNSSSEQQQEFQEEKESKSQHHHHHHHHRQNHPIVVIPWQTSLASSQQFNTATQASPQFNPNWFQSAFSAVAAAAAASQIPLSNLNAMYSAAINSSQSSSSVVAAAAAAAAVVTATSQLSSSSQYAYSSWQSQRLSSSQSVEQPLAIAQNSQQQQQISPYQQQYLFNSQQFQTYQQQQSQQQQQYHLSSSSYMSQNNPSYSLNHSLSSLFQPASLSSSQQQSSIQSQLHQQHSLSLHQSSSSASQPPQQQQQQQQQQQPISLTQPRFNFNPIIFSQSPGQQQSQQLFQLGSQHAWSSAQQQSQQQQQQQHQMPQTTQFSLFSSQQQQQQHYWERQHMQQQQQQQMLSPSIPPLLNSGHIHSSNNGISQQQMYHQQPLEDVSDLRQRCNSNVNDINYEEDDHHTLFNDDNFELMRQIENPLACDCRDYDEEDEEFVGNCENISEECQKKLKNNESIGVPTISHQRKFSIRINELYYRQQNSTEQSEIDNSNRYALSGGAISAAIQTQRRKLSKEKLCRGECPAAVSAAYSTSSHTHLPSLNDHIHQDNEEQSVHATNVDHSDHTQHHIELENTAANKTEGIKYVLKVPDVSSKIVAAQVDTQEEIAGEVDDEGEEEDDDDNGEEESNKPKKGRGGARKGKNASPVEEAGEGSNEGGAGSHYGELIADAPDFYTEEKKQAITDLMLKSNKKNVVRNLMRAFKQYFMGKNSGEHIMRHFFVGQNIKDVQAKFKRYFSSRKFNHHAIKQLVQHEKYGAVFNQFLKEHSSSYLEHSSVKTHQLHQVFIDFLLLCYRDINLLDNLETYSKLKNPFQ